MEYNDFVREIYMFSGINLLYYKEKQMKRRIEQLIMQKKLSGYEEYLQVIKSDNELYNEFLGHITINVSYFYRDPKQWEVLEYNILPEIIKRDNKIRSWCCACSSGEEAYTLAFILNRYISNDRIEIIGSDVDRKSIDKAKKGIYTKKNLETLPKVFFYNFFEEKKGEYIVVDEIKNCISFEIIDLLNHEYPQNFDLIICRNVMIYFLEEAKKYIYFNLNKSLNDEGILFMGNSEIILLHERYKFEALSNGFYKKIGEV